MKQIELYMSINKKIHVLTEGCGGCSCPLTFCSCLLCAVGVRSPGADDAPAAAPALLPAGDLACGELVDVVLRKNDPVRVLPDLLQ